MSQDTTRALSDIDHGRRRFVRGAAAFGVLSLTGMVGCARATDDGRASANANTSAEDGPVQIAMYDDAGDFQGLRSVERVTQTPEQWRDQLSDLAYRVTRESGTERSYSGRYYEQPDARGLYRCVCCDTALYTTETQFHSGTGWPSFYQPIDEHNIVEHRDTTFGMTRTEIACRRCGAHLGHVFQDGPPPTGLRYCMNSAALTFHPIT